MASEGTRNQPGHFSAVLRDPPLIQIESGGPFFWNITVDGKVFVLQLEGGEWRLSEQSGQEYKGAGWIGHAKISHTVALQRALDNLLEWRRVS